jgi:hypothetical protein
VENLIAIRYSFCSILKNPQIYNWEAGSSPLECPFFGEWSPLVPVAATSSLLSINLFQNQCFFHTLSVISSIGIFFVSGSRNTTNIDMMSTQLEKNKKMPNFKVQSMERKDCAITKVKIKLTQTT